MHTYETSPLNELELRKFLDLFDEKVGTEREENPTGDGQYYVLACELEPEEVGICRGIEAASRMVYRFRGFYIPSRMMYGIERYINHRQIPGDFLQAIICNDLSKAVAYADDENMRNLPAYVGYFYNKAPAACWGSVDKMVKWVNEIQPED